MEALGDQGGAAAQPEDEPAAGRSLQLLRQKIARYLPYTQDRAWAGRHSNCPLLLLLTTATSRAATFMRAAGPLLPGEPGYSQQRRMIDD